MTTILIIVLSLFLIVLSSFVIVLSLRLRWAKYDIEQYAQAYQDEKSAADYWYNTAYDLQDILGETTGIRNFIG